VAKSRKPARKAVRKASRKPSARRAKAARPAAKPKPNQVELRPIRTRATAELARLQNANQTDKVRDTIDRLNRILLEVEGACGPNMNVPLD
jgi:hypothetical protein